MEIAQVWREAFSSARKCLDDFIAHPSWVDNCTWFTRMLLETYRSGGNLFTCGNGGSHCDAMHFAEELTGRYRKDRRPLGALALGDPSHTTCVANDYGFEHIFARQLEGLGKPGDLLVGLSTSGNSQNVCRAFKVAQSKGIKTVGLLGRDGGQLMTMADLSIVVPSQVTDRIQEVHIKIIHTAIESVERQLFPENY